MVTNHHNNELHFVRGKEVIKHKASLCLNMLTSAEILQVRLLTASLVSQGVEFHEACEQALRETSIEFRRIEK